MNVYYRANTLSRLLLRQFGRCPPRALRAARQRRLEKVVLGLSAAIASCSCHQTMLTSRTDREPSITNRTCRGRAVRTIPLGTNPLLRLLNPTC